MQEVLGAMKYYDADKGFVITNNEFHKSAKLLAKKSDIELIDRFDLIEFIKSAYFS